MEVVPDVKRIDTRRFVQVDVADVIDHHVNHHLHTWYRRVTWCTHHRIHRTPAVGFVEQVLQVCRIAKGGVELVPVCRPERDTVRLGVLLNHLHTSNHDSPQASGQ